MKMSISNFSTWLAMPQRQRSGLQSLFYPHPERIHGNHHPRPALLSPAARLAHLFTPEKTGGAPAIASVAPLAGGGRFPSTDFIPGNDDEIRGSAPVYLGCRRAGWWLAGRAGPEADPLRTGR